MNNNGQFQQRQTPYNQQPMYQQPVYQGPTPKKGLSAGAIVAIVLGSIAFLTAVAIVFVMMFSVPRYRYNDYNDYYNDYDSDGNDYDYSDSYEISEKLQGPDLFSDAESVVYLGYAGRTISFEYEQTSVDYENRLLVNGQTTDLLFMWIGSIQIIDDTIILSTGGTDIKSTTVYALDMDGNIILEVFQLENNGMRIEDFEWPAFEIIHGDTILFHGSRLYHGPSLLTEDSFVDFEYKDGQYTSPFPDDEIVEAEYEMQYLGNGKFGSILRTEITLTLGDWKDQQNENVY